MKVTNEMLRYNFMNSNFDCKRLKYPYGKKCNVVYMFVSYVHCTIWKFRLIMTPMLCLFLIASLVEQTNVAILVE